MECDIPEFYDCHEVTARKEHHCCECDAPIEKGERHLIASGKWDGECRSFRQHLVCAEACMFVRDNLNGGDCICFGELDEWYHESRFQCNKTHPVWKSFRDMLAKIKRRERNPAWRAAAR